MNLIQKLGIGVAALTAGVVLAPTSAFAAGWNPISGTAYSSGDWYVSTNVRTKVNTTSVQVQFNNLPAHGLKFYIRNYNTGVQIGSTKFFPPLSAQTLASSVANGTKFVNVFALQSPSGGTYNFDGSEYY